MKIFVDFDRVACNTDQLYELLKSEDAPEAGTIESLDYLDGLDSGSRTKDLLYSDFIEFAERCRERGDELILISSARGFSADWELSYQKEKINRSCIGEYVTKILPVSDSKVAAIKAELQPGEKAMYIEDHPNHLQEVVHLNDEGYEINCIQMLRGKIRHTNTGRESVEGIPEFTQVKDFEAIDSMRNKPEQESDND